MFEKIFDIKIRCADSFVILQKRNRDLFSYV
nr:MAG TPA: hypothetical protein [Caudoviricetes sp.]